jgi:hypothetical protein
MGEAEPGTEVGLPEALVRLADPSPSSAAGEPTGMSSSLRPTGQPSLSASMRCIPKTGAVLRLRSSVGAVVAEYGADRAAEDAQV